MPHSGYQEPRTWRMREGHSRGNPVKELARAPGCNSRPFSPGMHTCRVGSPKKGPTRHSGSGSSSQVRFSVSSQNSGFRSLSIRKMSWTLDQDLFLEFELQADRNVEGTHSFLLDIWGQTPGEYDYVLVEHPPPPPLPTPGFKLG